MFRRPRSPECRFLGRKAPSGASVVAGWPYSLALRQRARRASQRGGVVGWSSRAKFRRVFRGKVVEKVPKRYMVGTEAHP